MILGKKINGEEKAEMFRFISDCLVVDGKTETTESRIYERAKKYSPIFARMQSSRFRSLLDLFLAGVNGVCSRKSGKSRVYLGVGLES